MPVYRPFLSLSESSRVLGLVWLERARYRRSCSSVLKPSSFWSFLRSRRNSRAALRIWRCSFSRSFILVVLNNYRLQAGRFARSTAGGTTAISPARPTTVDSKSTLVCVGHSVAHDRRFRILDAVASQVTPATISPNFPSPEGEGFPSSPKGTLKRLTWLWVGI